MLNENIFLIVIAFVWIIFSVIQDFKRREIENWWNFSLVAVALSYRAFLSLFSWDYRFFLYGLIGFVIFFLIGNLLYYSRVFGGGDAKLLYGLGAVLPFSSSFFSNLWIFSFFIAFFLFTGGIYGLVYSFVLVLKNKKKFIKELKIQLKQKRGLVNFLVILSVILAIFIIFLDSYLLMVFPMLLLIFPYLFIYGKAVEETCMVKKISPGRLREGDLLYEGIIVQGKKIKPDWEGLTEKDLKILRTYKGKVLIKDGIPFSPSFFFALILLLWII